MSTESSTPEDLIARATAEVERLRAKLAKDSIYNDRAALAEAERNLAELTAAKV